MPGDNNSLYNIVTLLETLLTEQAYANARLAAIEANTDRIP